MPNAPRIELPRPPLIAALGALILAVTFVVTHGSTTGSVPAPSSAGGTSTTTTPAKTTTKTAGKTPPAKPAKPAEPAVQPGRGLPSDVARALNRHEVVVLFFYEPAAADDEATRSAVRAVRAAGARVALFSDTVAHISSYSRVVGTLGISQTPAMVVIDKHRNARLYEGFLDAGTIRQSVRDAL